MEMVASVISEQAKTYALHKNRGETTEGLLLANELNECIKAYQEVNVISNLKLPKPTVYNVKQEEQPKRIQFGWREEKEPFQ